MQDDEDLLFDHEPSDGIDPPTDPLTDQADAVDDASSIDCAMVAAWNLLGRALTKISKHRRPGLYVVVAPGDH